MLIMIIMLTPIVTATPLGLREYTLDGTCDNDTIKYSILMIGMSFVVIAIGLLLWFFSPIPVLTMLYGFLSIWFGFVIGRCFVLAIILFVAFGVGTIIKGFSEVFT